MSAQHIPNHDKVAFKDMTPEERSVIVEAIINGNGECWDGQCWDKCGRGAIFIDTIFRTRPHQLTIPWEHIKPEYKWAVMNEDEGLWVYVVKPEIYNEEMWNIRGKCSPLPLNIDTTGIDWRESLTARPEGV